MSMTNAVVGTSDRRRTELGRYLRACRTRLTPEDVGLARGARRRSTGLRREEVATLAGVGITWYTWLEQGRAINVSGQVLDAVARALRLDTTERAHLYRLSDATPRRAGVDTTVIPDQVYSVLKGLDPLPAVLLNGRFDVLAANPAHEDLLRGWHTMPCVHKNMLWCHLTEPNARQTMLNYDDEVPYTVARLRRHYSDHVGDPEWEEDIRRLVATSQEFARLWDRHEVAEPEIRTRVLINPHAGRLTFSVSELEVASLPGLRVEVHTPMDADTEERLPLTRRRSDADWEISPSVMVPTPLEAR